MALTNEIKTIITADNKQFKSSIKEAASSVKEFSGKLTESFESVKKLLAGGILGGELLVQLKEGYESLDRLAASSEKLGISAEGFQFLEYAAKRTNTEVGSLEMAIRRMRVSLSNANLSSAFGSLGLNQQSLRQMSTEQAFTTVIANLQKLDKISQVDVGTKIFGRNFQELMIFANSNLKELNKNFQELGGAVKLDGFEDADRRIKDFDQSLTQLQRKMFLTFGSPALNVLDAFVNKINEVGTSIGTGIAATVDLAGGFKDSTKSRVQYGNLPNVNFSNLLGPLSNMLSSVRGGHPSLATQQDASSSVKGLDILGTTAAGTAGALKGLKDGVTEAATGLRQLLGLTPQSGAAYLSSILPQIKQVEDPWFTKIASDLRDAVAGGADLKSVPIQSRLSELGNIARSYNNPGAGLSNSGMINAVAELQKQISAGIPKKDQIEVLIKVDNNSFITAVVNSTTFKSATAVVNSSLMAAEAASTMATGG